MSNFVATILHRFDWPDIPSHTGIYLGLANCVQIEDEGDSPAPWQRGATLIAGVLGTFASGYLVLYADYGPQEHCFTSVRRPLTLQRHISYHDPMD